ncbi:MAG TPA: ATPase, T2SS/T4P/T4SS family [Terriglobia bacterium]|nr:ATPase, T2SS/T4P/T4SS family [Terriglobia bacterium]
MDLVQQHIPPLMKYVNMKDAAEVVVNRFGEILVECVGKPFKKFRDSTFDEEYWKRLARLHINDLDISNFEKKPILKTSLPGKHRLTLGIGRFIEEGIAVSIRVKRPIAFKLEDYPLGQAEDDGVTDITAGIDAPSDIDGRPEHICRLIRAVRQKKNILISGGTYSAKTSFMNVLAQEIPADERVVSVEDALAELDLARFDNRVEYRVSTGETTYELTHRDIIDLMNRMRPDRNIISELTTDNTTALLRMLNMGQGGLMTTVHADSAELAFDALGWNCRYSGVPQDAAIEFFRRRFDLVVQLRRRPRSSIREIAEIWERPTPSRILRAAE